MKLMNKLPWGTYVNDLINEFIMDWSHPDARKDLLEILEEVYEIGFSDGSIEMEASLGELL